jgi:plastocyanin
MDSSKVVVAVVVVLLLGGGAFFYFQNQKNGEEMMENSNQEKMEQTQASMAPTPTSNAMMASDSGSMEAKGVVKEFTVEGSNFKFMPSTMSVNKGDTVKVTFKNTGGFHDFVIDEFKSAKTKQIGANASETIEFVADKAGTFEYYCSVGNHRGMGMKGTLTVK